MLRSFFLAFEICAILLAFADQDPEQCKQMAKCIQRANDMMLNCINLVKAIEISKIQQNEREFGQCSDMFKDGKMRYIKAHDAVSNAFVKCLTGTTPLANFSCENEYFKHETNTARRIRRGELLDQAYDQAEQAQQCMDKAEEKWSSCTQTYEAACGDRAGLCDLCYEQSKSHDEYNKAGFDNWMGYIVCESKQPKEDQN